MDLSKLNPEINWQGKHLKISLAGLFGAAVMIALDPASAAVILPASWVPIVSVLAPKIIAGALGSGLLYNMDPNKGSATQPTPTITPEMIQGIIVSLMAASKSENPLTATAGTAGDAGAVITP